MYDDFSIYDVMMLVGLSSDKVKNRSGGYFTCPVCGGKNKFNVNPSVGRYGGVCRCAKCNTGGDKLDLYILASGGSYRLVTASSLNGSLYERPCEEDRSAALKEIEERLHISRKDSSFISRSLASAKRVAAEAKAEQPTSKDPKELDKVYRAFLNMLQLSPGHRCKLHERGLSDEDIDRIGFRTTPSFRRPQIAQALIDQGFTLEGIPGFFKLTQLNEETGEVKEEWSIYCPDTGYFVPIIDKDGRIVSMQIRLNKPTTAKDKYRFFSSNRESLQEGTKADSMVHVEMCADTPRFLYVVEGAIKAYVAHALYKELYGKDDIIILAVPGTSNLGQIPSLMEWLARYNIERVVEWYDLDKYTNEYVARDRNNLERILKEGMLKWLKTKKDVHDSGIASSRFASFPQERYKGKGIDDHLLAIKNEMINAAPRAASV